MKNLIKSCLLCALIVATNGIANAQSGAICGDPSQTKCVGQYDDFKPYDLIFNTGRAQLGAGTHHESVEFYAVILESVSATKADGRQCNFISETKRQRAQKLFPNNKVFASRQNCPGTIVGYANTSDEYNFMAVYAGESAADAAKILIKAKKISASANVRKLKIVLDFSDE